MMSTHLELCRFELLIAISAIFLLGCGEKRGLVPIEGQISFDGQPPPKSGRINFAPTKSAEGYPQRPGQASFDTDGAFKVTSYQPGDGLTPGEYRVNVICVEHDPSPVPGGMEAVTYVAPGYKGQEVVVASGSDPVDLKIDVPLKKRK